MRTILLLFSLLSITACHNVPFWKQNIFKHPPGNKAYQPDYITGWQDGCESGAEASANYLYRWKYQYRQNWSMLENDQYVSGWEDAYNYCRKFVLQHNLRSSK